MTTHYASLTGPLLGYYYPMPEEIENEKEFIKALNQSHLRLMWGAIYTSQQTDELVEMFGGFKLVNLKAPLNQDQHQLNIFRGKVHD